MEPIVLVAIIGVGGTALSAAVGVTGTVISTWLGNKHNRRLEKGQRKHERQIEKERWEYQERSRLREERLRAYQFFSKIITMTVSSQYRIEGPSQDQMAEAYAAIEVLASEGVQEVA